MSDTTSYGPDDAVQSIVEAMLARIANAAIERERTLREHLDFLDQHAEQSRRAKELEKERDEARTAYVQLTTDARALYKERDALKAERDHAEHRADACNATIDKVWKALGDGTGMKVIWEQVADVVAERDALATAEAERVRLEQSVRDLKKGREGRWRAHNEVPETGSGEVVIHGWRNQETGEERLAISKWFHVDGDAYWLPTSSLPPLPDAPVEEVGV